MRRAVVSLLAIILVVVTAACDEERDVSSIAEEGGLALEFVLPNQHGVTDRSHEGTKAIAASAAMFVAEECDPEQIYPPCDPSDDEVTAEDVFAMWPSLIYEKYSTGSVTNAFADGYGRTKYRGTHGYMETDLQLYYLGDFVDVLAASDDGENTVFENVYEAIGGCGDASLQSPPACLHQLDTHIQVGVGRECGNSITVRSKHKAEERYLGWLFNTTDWETSPAIYRSQSGCSDGPECDEPGCEDDGDGSGDEGGGGGGGTCGVYTCENLVLV